MKSKITLQRLCVLFTALFLTGTAQLNAQTFEAESFIGSAYASLNNSAYFSGGSALTLRASYGAYVYYQIDAATAGTYDLAIDYATMNTRRIYVQVENYQPTVVEFDDYTGDWNGSAGVDEEGNPVPGIKTKTIQIYLNQGENLLTIGAFDTGEQTDSPNIDKFTLSPSAQTMETPAQQTSFLVLEAEDATTQVGGELKDFPCYSGEKGVGSMNSGNDARLVFRNVNASQTGTYDLSVFYTTAERRKFYAKIGVQQKTIIDCTSITDYWECPETAPDNAPAVLKKTVQVYLTQGNNTVTVGAHGGWAPNIDKIEIQKSSLTIDEPDPEVAAAIFDYTDNVVSFEEDFTESVPTNKDNLKNLIDNNEFTDYVVPGVSSASVTVKLAYPIVLTGYAIASSYTNPVSLDDWRLEYSLNGTTGWTEVNQSLVTDNANYRKVRTGYSPNDETVVSAQYYRLTATGNSGVAIGEWQLFGLPFISGEQNFPDDDMTADVNFSDILSYATASADGFARGDVWNEVYENVFDKSAVTKYTVVEAKTFWIEFEVPDPLELKSYALSVHYTTEYSSRNPKKWKLEGYSANANDYVVLDSRDEMKFPEYGSTLMFNIAEPELCYIYRLTVEDNAGAGDVHLCQWQMFADYLSTTAVTTPKAKTSDVIAYAGKGKILLNSSAAKSLPYQIYNLTGQKVAQGVCQPGLNEIPFSQGLYIVRIDNHATKTMVR
jgi:hypothetical protein